MRKQLLTIVSLFLAIPLLSSAQEKDLKSFTVRGKINIDTGTIRLDYGERNKELYPKNFSPESSKIKDGKFIFTGKVHYPIWVSFKIGDTFNSGNTAIVSGIQNISIDTAQNDQKPENDNYVMSDGKKYGKTLGQYDAKILKYRLEYDSLFNIYGRKFPDDLMLKSMRELKSTYAINDSLLLAFVRDNPNSYYALYKLNSLLTFGYSSALGETYENLSSELKNSPIGKDTYNKIVSSKPTALGATIPTFNVENLNGGKLIADYYKGNKFTLVDMWYSHCMPCIAMFDDLKKIRNAYHNKGFEIIGISTDKTKFVEDWKSVIAKHELPWPQYLDLNGIETSKFNIHIFPTSFLVDNKGKIIASGLSTIELKAFLEQNL